MELDLTEDVETKLDHALLWRRMLDPSAVIGFLGGEATDVRPFESCGPDGAIGHTFRIKGVGGGVYHARIERRKDHVMVAYAVWREDAPDVLMLQTYSIETSGSLKLLAGAVTMSIPVAELLASFSLPGLLAMPLVGRLLRRYLAKRLRAHLLLMADSSGVSPDKEFNP